VRSFSWVGREGRISFATNIATTVKNMATSIKMKILPNSVSIKNTL
jgi:hypothetical protein